MHRSVELSNFKISGRPATENVDTHGNLIIKMIKNLAGPTCWAQLHSLAFSQAWLRGWTTATILVYLCYLRHKLHELIFISKKCQLVNIRLYQSVLAAAMRILQESLYILMVVCAPYLSSIKSWTVYAKLRGIGAAKYNPCWSPAAAATRLNFLLL